MPAQLYFSEFNHFCEHYFQFIVRFRKMYEQTKFEISNFKISVFVSNFVFKIIAVAS